jgi:uncharacterized protein (DUF2062 family)
MTENIHRGEFLAQSQALQNLNVLAIQAVREVYQRGVAVGVFRAGIDPIDLHMSISALSFSDTANRHTFASIFKQAAAIPATVAELQAELAKLRK